MSILLGSHDHARDFIADAKFLLTTSGLPDVQRKITMLAIILTGKSSIINFMISVFIFYDNSTLVVYNLSVHVFSKKQTFGIKNLQFEIAAKAYEGHYSIKKV